MGNGNGGGIGAVDVENGPMAAAHSVPGAGGRRGSADVAGPGSNDQVATIAVTFSGRVTLWAAGAQSMFGWNEEEAIGRPVRELADWGLTADDFAEFLFVASGGAWTRDVQVRDRHGRQRLFRVTATLTVGLDGADEVIATLQPIEHPGADAAVLDRPFRIIAERGSDLVVICDRDTVITYTGPSLREAYGYRSRDIIGTPAWRYVHPQDHPRLRHEWAAAVATPGDHRELELRIRDAEGAWRWVQLRISNLFADLAISAMVLNLRDITETRGLADRLEVSERMLAEIMDTAAEGVWVLDAAGRTVTANARMADLLKVDLARLGAGGIHDFIDPVSAELLEQRLSNRAPGVREQYEFSFVRRDGVRRWFLVSDAPRYDASGSFIGSIAMCTDITDRKFLERELERRSTPEAGTGGGFEPRYEAGPAPVGPGGSSEPRVGGPVPGLDRLSRREFEVVRMLLHGDRVPVIARQLFVSQSTVRNHLSSVFRKLRVSSQQELIVLLRERRLPR